MLSFWTCLHPPKFKLGSLFLVFTVFPIFSVVLNYCRAQWAGGGQASLPAALPPGPAPPAVGTSAVAANACAVADFPAGAGMQLATNPLYLDSDGADDIAGGSGWADDLLFLNPASPAIDRGSGDASARGVDTVSALGTAGLPDEDVADLGVHR